MWCCLCCHVDVVRAYRGALKEKEALEQTLKALSVQQEEMGGESGVEEGEEGERKGGEVRGVWSGGGGRERTVRGGRGKE